MEVAALEYMLVGVRCARTSWTAGCLICLGLLVRLIICWTRREVWFSDDKNH